MNELEKDTIIRLLWRAWKLAGQLDQCRAEISKGIEIIDGIKTSTRKYPTTSEASHDRS